MELGLDLLVVSAAVTPGAAGLEVRSRNHFCEAFGRAHLLGAAVMCVSRHFSRGLVPA